MEDRMLGFTQVSVSSVGMKFNFPSFANDS